MVWDRNRSAFLGTSRQDTTHHNIRTAMTTTSATARHHTSSSNTPSNQQYDYLNLVERNCFETKQPIDFCSGKRPTTYRQPLICALACLWVSALKLYCYISRAHVRSWSPYAMLCYAMLYHAMLCYAMLSYAMPCYATLCYAMLCCAMLCYAMLCQ